MFSRHRQDMSPRRLQDVFNGTILRLPRLLEDVLQDVSKTSSRPLQAVLARRLQDVFKTPSRRLRRQKIVTLKTC